MTSKTAPATDPSTSSPQGRRKSASRWLERLLVQGVLLVITGAAMLDLYQWRYGALNFWEPAWDLPKPAPLVMKGGDPYIRALMRTISASESNVPRPYSVMYGGDHFSDWSQHPDHCITIPVGPNTGNCSTAAGRYQFITTTWQDKAHKYHPEQPHVLFWRPYRFDPESQDVVVYNWLADTSEWGVDLSDLLRRGEIYQVLEMLSPTWTSLGYGIETNDMSAYLPEIYTEMLDEELASPELPTASRPLSEAQQESPEEPQAEPQAEPQEEGAEVQAAAVAHKPFLLPPGEVLRQLGEALKKTLGDS